MKLLVFSDTHGDLKALERQMAIEADYYIHAGDLTSWGRGLDKAGDILRRRPGQVWVLPGNHESHAQVAEFARKFELHDFHGQSFQADGFHVAGLGYSSPTPFDTPGEYSEDEIEHRLAPFAALKPLILICHCPPYGTDLDKVKEGVHAGSHAIARFLAENQPTAFFSGHIHEAEGTRIQLGRTLCYNPGKQGVLLDSATLKE